MVQQRGIRKRPKAVRVAEIKAIFQSCGTNLAAFQTLSLTSNLQQFGATDQYKKARLEGEFDGVERSSEPSRQITMMMVECFDAERHHTKI